MLVSKKIFAFHFLLKFGVFFIILTLLNLNMMTRLPSYPPVLREVIQFKIYIRNKKKGNVLGFNYNLYCQIMSSVSIYGIRTRKKFVKHRFCLLVPLIFTRLCLPYKTSAVVSQLIWTSFSTLPVFSWGNILMEPFTMFVGNGSHVFGEKI